MKPKAATFTPGPWRAAGPFATHIETVGDPYRHGPMHVADVRGWGHLTGQGGGCAMDEADAIAIQEANARLIAAAPELLEALKALRIDANRLCDRNLGGTYEEDCRRSIALADAAITKALVAA